MLLTGDRGVSQTTPLERALGRAGRIFFLDEVSVGSGSSRLPARQVAKLQFKIMFTQVRRRCAHAF